MVGIIIGMVLGSLVVIIIISYLISTGIKSHNINSLSKRLGQTAENIVNKDIATWAKHTNNKFIKSSLYKYSHNKVFEVDGILITNKCIVVLEVKSIKGKIIGDAKNNKWTKKLGDKEFAITNPIIQNDKHIEHLMNILKIKVPIVSLIVYSNRSETIELSNKPQHVIVIRHSELFNALDKIDSTLEYKISKNQIKNITKIIKGHKTNNINDIKLHNDITGKYKK